MKKIEQQDVLIKVCITVGKNQKGYNDGIHLEESKYFYQ